MNTKKKTDLSHIARALKSGDHEAAKKDWHTLIQSLSKSTDGIRERDVNLLIRQAISPILEGVKSEIAASLELLNTVGDDGRRDDAQLDDAQLAYVDLQNMLQKQQQTLQMLSNISKMLHDTAQAIIRKIGG
jgi:hypothetical protein